ncbi:P-II family nitrogen regulator [Clostridium gasigenes]|uniref:P-II family nitrogen regulator n=1 Tax=Clostridium gasigenes TaxID=94869 RepID=A0A7X0VS57_9CLOT|nr:P-II family nitrogen regulator [Clostridium gasigenes]MBB6715365.1 P-II family nitrogen regulator [Clostridium gasigenes]MBU3108570.1 P-II family nitrogen regulator [Clostridium gasigenes]
MKKIEAIIRPTKLEELKEALKEGQINGITISQVMGCGQQLGWSEYYRGNEVLIHFLPKVEIKIVVEDYKVSEVVKLIIDVTRTGEAGDGKIFISDISEVIRIRTGETGKEAL